MSLKSRQSESAFSLTELLVVVGVIVVLVSLLLPVTQKSRKASSDAVCANNLRKLATAINLYAAEHDGQIPYTTEPIYRPDRWHARIYPYLDPGKSEGDWATDNTIRNDSNSRRWTYSCPSSDNPKSAGCFALSYAINENLKDKRILSFDQPAKMVLLLDFYNNYVAVGTKDNLDGRLPVGKLVDGVDHIWHNGSANLAFLDGHVERRRKSEILDSAKDPLLWKGKNQRLRSLSGSQVHHRREVPGDFGGERPRHCLVNRQLCPHASSRPFPGKNPDRIPPSIWIFSQIPAGLSRTSEGGLA